MREENLQRCLHLVVAEAPQVNEEVPVGVGHRRLQLATQDKLLPRSSGGCEQG